MQIEMDEIMKPILNQRLPEKILEEIDPAIFALQDKMARILIPCVLEAIKPQIVQIMAHMVYSVMNPPFIYTNEEKERFERAKEVVQNAIDANGGLFQ